MFTVTIASSITTTTDVPEQADAAAPTTTLANNVNNGNNGAQQPAVTTTAKPLTCKSGSCTNSKDECTGKSGPSTTQCKTGEVCGVTVGSGNDTLNDYTFKCSAKTDCDKNGLKCCSRNDCFPADDNSGCSYVHVKFATIALVLLAIKAFL